jgi:hypothetical protein
MIRRGSLALSLMVPLVATSATANAGATISDRRYWPSEARQAGYPIIIGRGNPSASSAVTPRFEGAPTAYKDCRFAPHQGGPKSPVTRACGR